MKSLKSKIYNREYMRGYYRKNREKILAYQKKYREKNREKIRKRDKEYYWKNREKLLIDAKKFREKNKEKLKKKREEYYYKNRERILKNLKKWREKNRVRLGELNRSYREKKKQEVIKMLGEECIICGQKNPIHYHEIHGKRHYGGYSGYIYILKHLEDFVPLCGWCHRMIHQLSKNRDKINEIVELSKKIKNSF